MELSDIKEVSRSEAKLHCLQITRRVWSRLATRSRWRVALMGPPEKRPCLEGTRASWRAAARLERNGSTAYMAVTNDDELYSWMDEMNQVRNG